MGEAVAEAAIISLAVGLGDIQIAPGSPT